MLAMFQTLSTLSKPHSNPAVPVRKVGSVLKCISKVSGGTPPPRKCPSSPFTHTLPIASAMKPTAGAAQTQPAFTLWTDSSCGCSIQRTSKMWAGIPAECFPMDPVGSPTESLDLTEPRPPGSHPSSAASSLCDFIE